MLNLADIQEALLDSDGTTRDITFKPAPRAALEQFLTVLLKDYEVESAFDNYGCDVGNPLRDRDFTALLDTPKGYIHATLASRISIISRLQVFCHWAESHGYAVELSFFPNDLLQPFELARFLDLVDRYSSKLESEDYFVRYEDATWQLYDAHSRGVIYTGGQRKRAQQDARTSK